MDSYLTNQHDENGPVAVSSPPGMPIDVEKEQGIWMAETGTEPALIRAKLTYFFLFQ
jgi:hypothetical protein